MDWVDIVTRILADWLIVLIILITVVVFARLPRKKLPRALVWAIIVVVLGYIVGRMLSLLYTGDRPYLMMGVPPGAWAADNSGFPSEHAFFAFALTLIVWVNTHKKQLTLFLLTLSCLVAIGRVIALVHTPLDVVTGAVIAGLTAWFVYRDHLFKTH